MKKSILFLLLHISSLSFAQKENLSKMGQTNLDELKMTVYDKDSTASAVVLYEYKNQFPDKKSNGTYTKEYYFRIKILNESSFNLANVAIGFDKDEKIYNLKAATYNISETGNIDRAILSKKDIFTTKENNYWVSKKFTFPNIKKGSVIEYRYTISSPYFGISDWYFQSHIPKIKSEFDVSILGRFQYNIRLLGLLKLDKNEHSFNKKCPSIDGFCVKYSFGMYDVPAFKEEEEYMLSKKNYISHITFDLKTLSTYTRGTNEYTSTWKQADKSLKKFFFNNQTTKKSFFKSKIPQSILTINNNLERAKQVYNFIKNHYTWNDQNWTNEDVKLKDAYNRKSGDVGVINLSLYNSLKAAKIDANLVVLSTRENGIPTKLFPVIFDFNYVIIKVSINGENYYLDATDKYLPFGQLPIRTLNGEARTIDAKEDSNWEILKPKFSSNKNVELNLTLNDDSEFSGNLSINRSGYFALKQRKLISLKKEDDYLELFEEDNPYLEIEEYKNVNADLLDKSLIENFKIKLLFTDSLESKIRINPFFFERIKENPFKLKERNYPVDFGYPRRNNFSLKLIIPENYKISQLPKDLIISLPNKGGKYILRTIVKGNIIDILSRFSITKKEYSVSEYNYLKEFYKQIIIAENDYIILEKK